MKKSAFTLIELSIVLVIIGLLIGGSFKILKVMRERAQISRAQDDVQVAKQAIIGNSIINDNTLPDQDFFKKNLSPIKNNQHQIFYAYDTNLTATNICSFKKTGLTVTKYKWNDDKSGEEKDKVIENVAFVIASESQNHNMQTALKDGNVKFHAPFYKVDDNTTPVNRVEGYDDIVAWVTLGQLKEELHCTQTGLKILNENNLIDGIDTEQYGVNEIFADGGTTSNNDNKYRWCAQYDTSSENNWLQVQCDNGSQEDLKANCSTATYKSCNHFKVEGKDDTNASTGPHKITIFLQDDAQTSIHKNFAIKINHNTSNSAGGKSVQEIKGKLWHKINR